MKLREVHLAQRESKILRLIEVKPEIISRLKPHAVVSQRAMRVYKISSPILSSGKSLAVCERWKLMITYSSVAHKIML